MDGMDKSYSGGCICGKTRFLATGDAPVHLCSCDICQKHTGALTAAWAEFAADKVQWTGEGGRPSVWRSSPHSNRAFCPECGSSLGAIDDAPTVSLLIGTFDNPHDPSLVAEGHSFEDMAPAWWQHRLNSGGVE